MSDKRKDATNIAISAMTLLPTALGVVHYAPGVLNQLRRASGDISSQLASHFNNMVDLDGLIDILKGTESTHSGSKVRDALITGRSGVTTVSGEASNKNLKKVIEDNKRVKELIFKTRTDRRIKYTKKRLSKHLAKMETPRKFLATIAFEEGGKSISMPLSVRDLRLQKYAAFLAHKRVYGVMADHVNVMRLDNSTLDVYWQELQHRLDRNDPNSVRVKELYLQYIRDIQENPETWQARLKALYVDKDEPVRMADKRRITIFNTGHKINIDDTVGLIKTLEDFSKPGDPRVANAVDEVLGYANIPKDIPHRQALELANTIKVYRDALTEAKRTAARAYRSAILSGNKEAIEDARRLYNNMERATMEVGLRHRMMGGESRKSVVIEVFNTIYGKPVRDVFEINLQQGIYTPGGLGTSLTVNPQFVPFAESRPSNALSITTHEARRLRAVADRYFKDLLDFEGVPGRGSGLIRNIHEQVYGKSSLKSGTARDVLGATSYHFQDLDLAIGQGSKREYTKIRDGVVSLERLQKAVSNGENVMIFDLEFMHPDMMTGAIGPQKAVTDPRTRIFQFSAKIVNMKSQEQLANLDILLDPGADYIEGIKDFYKKQGIGGKELDAFINKELIGRDGRIGPNRYRRKNLSDALRMVADFATEHRVSATMGQNIIGADIPLIRTHLKHLADPELTAQFERLLSVDPIRSTNHTVIDLYAIESVLGLGKTTNSNSLSDTYLRYTGIDAGSTLEDGRNPFADIIRLAKSNSSSDKIPVRALQRIAKDFNAKPADVIKLYQQVKKSKLSTLPSAIGVHNADFDNSMAFITALYQHQQIRNLPFAEAEYKALGRIANQMLQNGATNWNAPFTAMDIMRPGIFSRSLSDDQDLFSLSLYTSSQQQAAKLIGSALQMQHLIPFGLLNNMMRQHYQSFAGWAFAPPTEEVLKESPFPYMPGDLLSTRQGKAVHDLTRMGGGSAAVPEEAYHSLVVPTLYVPENKMAGTFGDQGYIHEGLKGLASYFHGSNKTMHITVELPERLRAITPRKLLQNSGLDLEQNLHPAIYKALQRRIDMTHSQAAMDSWLNHGSVMAALNKKQAAEVFHAYRRKGIDEQVLDGSVRDYIIRKDETLFGSYGLQHAKEEHYTSKNIGVVLDAMYDQETGNIIVNYSQMNTAQPGMKLIAGETKVSKAVIYGTIGAANDAIGYGLGTHGAVMPVRLGGSRNEAGSFISVQIGRILKQLYDDPKYNTDPGKLRTRAKQIFKPLLGDNVEYRIHQVGIDKPRYRLELILPSYETQQMYDKLTGENILGMLKRGGRSYAYVKKAFETQVQGLTDNKLRDDARRGYDEALSKHIQDLKKRIHTLERLASGSEASPDVHSALAYYNELLRSAINHQTGKDDSGAALFDMTVHTYGNKVAAVASYDVLESIRVVNDIMDYADKDITRFLETRMKTPLGDTRFRPYFTTLFEENILRSAPNPDNLINLIKSGLGMAYVNSEGKMPIAESAAVIRQSIELLKRAPSSSAGIQSIEELFSAADWLNDYLSSDNKALIQSISSKDRYRLLSAQEAENIGEILSRDYQSAYARQRTLGADSDSAVDRLVSKGMSRSAAESVLKQRDFRLFVDTFEDLPIFNQQDKTRINLLKISNARDVLKRAGYEGPMTGFDINLNFGKDFATTLMDELNLPELQRNRWEQLLKGVKTTSSDLGFIPIPQLVDGLAQPIHDENGMRVLMSSAKIRSIGTVLRRYAEREQIIKDIEERITNHSGSIEELALSEEIAALREKNIALQESIPGFIKSVYGNSLKELAEKGQLSFSKAQYGLHANSTNKLLAVVQKTLSDPEYRAANNISDSVFRRVVSLAAQGDAKLEKLASTKDITSPAYKQLVETLIHKNESTVTFGGFGLTEGVIPASEAARIRKSILRDAAYARKAGVLTKELYDEQKTILDNWVKGRDFWTDVVLKEPSYSHQRTPIRQVYSLPDKIYRLAGISNDVAKSNIMVNVLMSKAISDNWDFDGDIMARINTDMLSTFREMRELSVNQSHRLEDFIKKADRFSGMTELFPLRTDEFDRQGHRVIAKLSDTNSIMLDMDKDVPDIHKQSYFEQTKNVKDSLIIKAFTGVIGISTMGAIARASGEGSPFREIPKLVNMNKDLARQLEQSTGYSVKDINNAYNTLYNGFKEGGGYGEDLISQYMDWRGMLPERVSIVKHKVTNSDGSIQYLDKFTEFLKRMNSGTLTEDDIRFAATDPTLVANEANTLTFMYGKTGQEAMEASNAMLRATNVLNRVASEVNTLLTGNPDRITRELNSRVGVSGVYQFLTQWAQAFPEIRPSVLRQRLGIEKMVGMPINPFNFTAGDLDVGRGPAGTLLKSANLRETIGEMFESSGMKLKLGETLEQMMGLSMGRYAKLSALALGALAFFSPNMGVEPVGKGGETYDWPTMQGSQITRMDNQTPTVDIRPPQAKTIEKLIDWVDPEYKRREVQSKYPYRPLTPSYVSDLKNRNWTMQSYLDKSNAVLMN